MSLWWSRMRRSTRFSVRSETGEGPRAGAWEAQGAAAARGRGSHLSVLLHPFLPTLFVLQPPPPRVLPSANLPEPLSLVTRPQLLGPRVVAAPPERTLAHQPTMRFETGGAR
eukprot:3524316-Rhodomonas_salina.2